MAALAYELWLGVSLGLCLCEPSIAVAVILWLWFALYVVCIRPKDKVKAVLLLFWLAVALALSLVEPSMKATMLLQLWFCLGFAVGFALTPPSKKAAMKAQLCQMLECIVARLGQMIEYIGPSKAASWPDLPPELLGLVLLRMTSLADRIRICAVCRSWRSGARLQPLPPLLPWVALRDGTFISLPDAAIHRTPVADYDCVLYRVSTGRMLFLVERDGGCFLMNPSWKATALQINPYYLELKYQLNLRKVVVSDDLHTVAVLTTGKTNGKNVTVYARELQGTTAIEWGAPVNSHTFDIAIFNGKLYVLTREYYDLPDLYVLKVGNNMSIRFVQCIRSTHRDNELGHFVFYLVASGNRLLTVGQIVYPRPFDMQRRPLTSECFKVFEAADLSSGHGWWSEVDTLMGHALFLSRGCSRSLALGGQSVSGGPQEDCMYFMSELGGFTYIEADILNSCVYNMRDQTVAPLPLETVQPLPREWGRWCPTWLFPEEN
ncbi:unnamed protein product [Alopecurus aequalis]